MKRKRNIGSGLKAFEAPPPKEGVNLADLFLSDEEKDKSFLFDGPRNTVPAGRPIPTIQFTGRGPRVPRNLGAIPKGGLAVGRMRVYNFIAEGWRLYAFADYERREHNELGMLTRIERTAKWTVDTRSARLPPELSNINNVFAIEGRYWSVTSMEHYSRTVYDFHAREWFPPDE